MLPRIAVHILLALSLTACQSSKSIQQTSPEGPPPPDLTARPWGQSSRLVTAIEQNSELEARALLGPLRDSREIPEVMAQLQGFQLLEERINGDNGFVWLKSNKDESQFQLLTFRRSGESWKLVSIENSVAP